MMARGPKLKMNEPKKNALADARKNILFVSHGRPQLRHFVGLFEILAARGHSITIMAQHRREEPQRLPALLNHIEGLEIVPIVLPEAPWGEYSRAIRASRNYFLYYEEEFKNATIFRERCYGWVDENLKAHIPPDRPPHARFVRWLRDVENAIPPSAAIQDFLIQGGYDAVIVCPYIFYESTFQTDYVKCCHHLGMPVGFPVFSWDNLTTKGNVQVLPDRIWVWNDIQRRELVELHKVPNERIGVMGAWRFDGFSRLKPSMSRGEFFAQYGFDANKPLIAYLGSSPAIAPEEGKFVARWLAALRSHSDPLVASAVVLVRAHPRNVAAWKKTEAIMNDPDIAFQEPSVKLFEGQGLFDLLFYSHAAVGLNTSAMLEAAILRKPVHTIKDRRTASARDGTVHFDYLTTAGGGLINVAENFKDHLKRLRASLKLPLGTPDRKAASFAREFIDAGGDGPEASAIALADEVERLASMDKRPIRQTIRQRLHGRYLAARIRFGRLKLEKDPDRGAAIPRMDRCRPPPIG